MFIQRVDLGKHVHPSIFGGAQNCVRARIHSLIEFAMKIFFQHAC